MHCSLLRICSPMLRCALYPAISSSVSPPGDSRHAVEGGARGQARSGPGGAQTGTTGEPRTGAPTAGRTRRSGAPMTARFLSPGGRQSEGGTLRRTEAACHAAATAGSAARSPRVLRADARRGRGWLGRVGNRAAARRGRTSSQAGCLHRQRWRDMARGRQHLQRWWCLTLPRSSHRSYSCFLVAGRCQVSAPRPLCHTAKKLRGSFLLGHTWQTESAARCQASGVPLAAPLLGIWPAWARRYGLLPTLHCNLFLLQALRYTLHHTLRYTLRCTRRYTLRCSLLQTLRHTLPSLCSEPAAPWHQWPPRRLQPRV